MGCTPRFRESLQGHPAPLGVCVSPAIATGRAVVGKALTPVNPTTRALDSRSAKGLGSDLCNPQTCWCRANLYSEKFVCPVLLKALWGFPYIPIDSHSPRCTVILGCRQELQDRTWGDQVGWAQAVGKGRLDGREWGMGGVGFGGPGKLGVTFA